MSKVKIEHELLESRIATATALFDQWIKWCKDNGIKSYQIPHITQAFNVKAEDSRDD